ncbi:MAG: alpha/beta fold hydrolase, partial [Candidatus Limnocylindria bacterium]
RTAGGVETSLRSSADDRLVVLIGHSGAGPLLPAIGATLRQPVAAYVFVDAGLPSGGHSRLEAMATEDATLATEFRAALAAGQHIPDWSDHDLRELVPDSGRRQALLDALRPRGADYWTEELPTVSGWPNAPCGYLHFSEAYRSAAERAIRAGWPVRHMPAGHFHQIVDPHAVAEAIVEVLDACGIRSSRTATSQKGAIA